MQLLDSFLIPSKNSFLEGFGIFLEMSLLIFVLLKNKGHYKCQ